MNEASVMILETVSGSVQILLKWIIDQCGSSKRVCGFNVPRSQRAYKSHDVSRSVKSGVWLLFRVQFELILFLDITICQMIVGVCCLVRKIVNEFGRFTIFPWKMFTWQSFMWSLYLDVVSRITVLTWEKVHINLVWELMFTKPQRSNEQPGNAAVSKLKNSCRDASEGKKKRHFTFTWVF